MKKLFTLFAVAVMAFAAQAATLTVAEGVQTNAHYPFYGLYYDTEGTTSQVIYPAEMLTDMVGKQSPSSGSLLAALWLLTVVFWSIL